MSAKYLKRFPKSDASTVQFEKQHKYIKIFFEILLKVQETNYILED